MKLRIFELNPVFHHPPIDGPKQLCALAQLGCIREVGTFWLILKHVSFYQNFEVLVL